MIWHNLNIATKIAISFLIPLVLVVVTVSWALYVSQRIALLADEVREESLMLATTAQRMDKNVIQIERWFNYVSATRGNTQKETGLQQAASHYQSFISGIEIFETHFRKLDNAEQLANLKSLRARGDFYYNMGQIMAKTYVDQGPEAGNLIMDEFNKAATTLSETLQPFIEQQNATVTSKIDLITETVHTLVQRETWGVLFLVLVLTGSGWLLALSITRPLKVGVRLIQALADGDLTHKKLSRKSNDEIGQLLQALDSMYQRLAEIVREVHRAADDIAEASRNISDNNVKLSDSTEENANMLNQATASMNDLASTVGTTASNASRANELASQAKSIAAEGALAVSNTIGAMDQLDHGSQKISGTIGVIDDIAFQTNLLALNASIEAAQAGEKGRGFAVVASEVRQLALRSADAAHDIKRVIEDSTQRVETFSAQVDASGEALAEIVGSVKQVSDVMSEIAQANIELSRNIEQINRAMTRMNDVTGKNNDIVRLTARGAVTLSDQASRLSELMNFFKLDETGLIKPDNEER